MAYITVLSKTDTTITVCMDALDTSYEKNDRTVAWYIDGVKKATVPISAKVSSGGRYTFTGLKANTTYAISSHVIWDSGSADWSTSATTDRPSISLWSWSKSNGSATAAQTQTAYNAVTGKGRLDSFSYLVWNDMVDKVLEVLNAKGGSWSNAFASAAATKMTSTDKLVTAVRFNSLRYNIDLHSSTGIGSVSKGDLIYGSYFPTLTDHINSWISS